MSGSNGFALMTAPRVAISALVLALCYYYAFAGQLLQSSEFILPSGKQVGGDFIAFWAAARASVSGGAALAYDPVYFETLLLDIGPPRDGFFLTWQYPPTYYLAVSFLALLPFGLGYAVWTGGGLAIFAATARASGLKGAPFWIVLAAPAVFLGAATGQNGFFTASLLAGAALLARDRPIAAGLCAALLTMKPQLGLLIPIAYMAGGCWRAFIVAAVGSAALALASVVAYGPAPWVAFFESVIGVSHQVGAGAMPLFKMPTLYSAFAIVGAPKALALVIHGLGALSAIFIVAFVWRRTDDAALRAGVVAAGTFFVSPYIYFYELTILLIPLALLAIRARDEGWLRNDQVLLTAAYIAPIFLLSFKTFNLGVLASAFAFIFVLERVRLLERGARRSAAS
ncbi:MAG: glycosyltransferase family 87 protein [Pseudomonadota bacterium]